MHLIQRVKRAYNALRYLESTVLLTDNKQRRREQVEKADLVARAVSWVWLAAEINASNCASTPIRLYAPERSSARKVYGGERVGRERAAWLRQPMHGPLLGRKSVYWAERAGDIVEVKEHPALELLDYGNRNQTGGEVQEATHLFRELTGDAYQHVVLGRSTGNPVELWVMAAHWVRVIPSDTEFIAGYVYGRERQRELDFTPDEVLHFRQSPDPDNPYYGRSWLRAGATEADIHRAARQHELSSWDHNARPDYMVALKGAGATSEKAQALQDQVEARHRSPTRSGKVQVFAAQDIEFHTLSFPPKEMEYLAGLDNSRDAIMALAGVPKSMYTTDDVNLANAVEGRKQYGLRTLIPRLQKYVDTLNMRLLPMFGIEPGEMWFAFDNPVQEDEQAIAQRDAMMVQAGIKLIDEARAQQGLDPLPGGVGEVPRVAGFPMQSLGTPARLPSDAELADSEQAEDDPEPDDEPEKSITLRRKAIEPAEAPRPLELDTADFEAALARYFALQRRALAQYIRSGGDLSSFEVSLAPVKAGKENWAQRLARLLLGQTEQFVTLGALDELSKLVSPEPDFNLQSPGVRQFFADREALLVRVSEDITRETEDQLRPVIRDAMEQGLTTTEIAQRVEAKFEEFGPTRSLRIARTESTNAYTQGRVVGMAEAERVVGRQVRKRWVLAPNACALCQAVAQAHPAPIPHDQPFVKQGQTVTGSDGRSMTAKFDVMGPPLHPNDRCTVVSEFVSQDEPESMRLGLRQRIGE